MNYVTIPSWMTRDDTADVLEECAAAHHQRGAGGELRREICGYLPPFQTMAIIVMMTFVMCCITLRNFNITWFEIGLATIFSVLTGLIIRRNKLFYLVLYEPTFCLPVQL